MSARVSQFEKFAVRAAAVGQTPKGAARAITRAEPAKCPRCLVFSVIPKPLAASGTLYCCKCFAEYREDPKEQRAVEAKERQADIVAKYLPETQMQEVAPPAAVRHLEGAEARIAGRELRERLRKLHEMEALAWDLLSDATVTAYSDEKNRARSIRETGALLESVARDCDAHADALFQWTRERFRPVTNRDDAPPWNWVCYAANQDAKAIADRARGLFGALANVLGRVEREEREKR